MTSYELLKKLEWSGPKKWSYKYDWELTCPICSETEPDHATDCELDAELKRVVIEVEIPEPNRLNKNCSVLCPLFHLLPSMTYCALKLADETGKYCKPGPGCPWYEP